MTTNLSMHYVCTMKEAEQIIAQQKEFWISNCGCRESRGECSRSRMDICLMFTEEDMGSGSGKRKVSKKDVEEIVEESKTKHLVARPFRNEARTKTDGICFCCDDCCGYFLDSSEKCDKGKFIEKTDREKCTDCGICVDVCYFNAKKREDEELIIERENCYGCGLCLDVCPEECIEMIERTEQEKDDNYEDKDYQAGDDV